MTDLEKRACEALHQAFCRQRYFSRFPLNKQGHEHLFLVADASHNIPHALAGDTYHRPNLERDVSVLETLLQEPYGLALDKYVVHTAAHPPIFQRLRAVLGF